MKSKILVVVSSNSKNKNNLQIFHTSGMINENLFKKIKGGKKRINSIKKIKIFYVNQNLYVVIRASLKDVVFFSVGVGNTADMALINAEKKLEKLMNVKSPRYKLVEKTT